jgi:hypothetical protein
MYTNYENLLRKEWYKLHNDNRTERIIEWQTTKKTAAVSHIRSVIGTLTTGEVNKKLAETSPLQQPSWHLTWFHINYTGTLSLMQLTKDRSEIWQ